MTKKEITLTKAQFALEIGKAYRRGLTEGVIAERNGNTDFVNRRIIRKIYNASIRRCNTMLINFISGMCVVIAMATGRTDVCVTGMFAIVCITGAELIKKVTNNGEA